MPGMETVVSSIPLRDDQPILTSCSFKGSDNVCADTISDENIILEDWESYWNDLSARLTVSRMVSDSVIRGIVNAVVQEAEESNSVKEAEIARLVKRLLLYEPDMAIECRSSSMISKEQHDHVGQTMGNTRHLLNLSIAAEKHLLSLKSGIESLRSSDFCKVLNAGYESFRSCCMHDHIKASNNLTRLGESVDALEVIFTTICQEIDVLTYLSKDSQFDQQWEWKFQREIDSIIYESFLKEQREAIDMALCKQKNMFDIQNNFWLKEVQELSCLHQELDSISKSILSIEPEHPHAHEIFKDRNTSKRKDQFINKMHGDDFAITTSHVGENGIPSREKVNKETPEVSDSNLLFNMSKEDLMSYYQNEINKIKRQYEAALHESTEEVFRFKRQYLNEWGSLHHKKDKDLELLKKRIPDIVSKLGKVLLDTKKFSSIQEQHDNTCTFKQRIGSLTVKNRHLHDLLSNKGKEVDYLSLQLSYSKKQLANYSTKEVNFLKEVEKHNWDIKNMMVEARRKIEDVQMEDFIKNQVYKCVISDLICKVGSQMEDMYMENMLIQEFYSFTLRGLVMDAYSSMILTLMHDEEKRALIRTISQNEVALELENEKTRQLKQEHSKLMVMINEKENALSRELKKSEGLHQEIMALSGFLEKQNNFISDLELKLVQQNGHVDVVLKDLILLKDQASEKNKLVSEDKRGTNLLKMELDKALKRNQLLDALISDLNQRLGVLSTELREAEKQKAALSNIIQLKQNEITSLSTDLREVEKQKANLSDVVQQKQSENLLVTAQRDEQVEQLESIVIFVQGLSESVAEFESIIMLSIERRSSRPTSVLWIP